VLNVNLKTYGRCSSVGLGFALQILISLA